MAANPSGTLEGGDLDRLEAQRKALSGLLARFTADRDALITSVQACEQRVAALAARLDTGAVGTAADGQSGEVHNPTEVQALRVVIDELRRDQHDAITHARKTAEHAMFRADAALQSLEELRLSPAPAQNENAGALLARFTADRDSLITSVAETQQRLANLTARLDGLTAGDTSTASLGPLEPLEQSAEIRHLADQALQRSNDALRALDNLAPTVRRDIEELTRRAAEGHEALQASLHAVEEQLATVIEHVHEARQDADSRVDTSNEHALAQSQEVLQRVDALAAAQHAGEARVAQFEDQWPAERAALIGAVQESEQRLRQLIEQAHNAQDRTESQAQAAEAALSAMQQAMDVRTTEILARVAADRETLISLLQAGEQSLALLAARLDASQTNPPQLAELRRLIDQLQQTQHEFDARVSGTEHGLQQTVDIFARLEELATVQRAQHTQTTDLATRLATDRESLIAMVHAGEQRLTALADLLDASEADDSPQLDGLRDLVERVQRAHQEAATSLRAENERAAAQSAEALQRIDALAAALQDRDAQMAASSVQLAADREALVALIHSSEQRLAEVADRLDTIEAAAQPEREAIRQLAQEMHAEQQRVTEDLRAVVASNTDAARQQIEALSGALRSRDAHTADLEARIATDREALVGLLQDADERLAALAERLDSDDGVPPDQLDAVRRLAEEIQQHQEQAAVLFQAADAQALAHIGAAQQRLEEITAAQHSERAQAAELAERLAADREALGNLVSGSEQRLAALAARVDGIECDLRPEIDELHTLVERTRQEQQDTIAQVRSNVVEVARRLEETADARGTRDLEVSALHARLTADHEALVGLVQDAEQRLDTFASRLDATDTHAPAQLAELRSLIDQAHSAQHDIAARVSAAEDSLTHNTDALPHLDALRAAQNACNAQTAELSARVTSDREALAGALREGEQQLAALVARLDATDPHGPAQFAELHRLIDQLHGAHRDVATRVATAEHSLVHAIAALQRVEELAAAHQAREANTAHLVNRVTADHDALVGLVQEVEQRFSTLAARVDTTEADSSTQLAALRGLIDEVHDAHRHVAARVAAAEDSLAHTVDDLRDTRDLIATYHSQETQTAEAVARLAADREALVSLMQGSEQRAAALTARLDTFEASGGAPLASLTEWIERIDADRQHDAEALRDQTHEALLRAEEGLQRIDELAATGHTRDQHITDRVARLATDHAELTTSMDAATQRLSASIDELHQTQQQVDTQVHAATTQLTTLQHAAEAQIAELVAHVAADRDSLVDLVQDAEHRLTSLAARLDDVESNGPTQLAGIRELVEQLRQAQATVESRLDGTTAHALARAEEVLQQIEVLAAAQQACDQHSEEVAARLSAEQTVLTASIDAATQRLTASIDELHQAQQQIDTQVHAATEQLTIIEHAAEAQIAELVAHVAANRDALVDLVQDAEQRLTALAARLDDVETYGPAQLADIRTLIGQLQHAQQEAGLRLDVTTAQASAHAADALLQVEALAATQQARDQQSEDLAARLTADQAVLTAVIDAATQRLTASLDELHQAQQQVHTQVHATAERLITLEHTAETQIAELAATQQGREQRSEEIATRLTADHAALTASIEQLRNAQQYADTQAQATAEHIDAVQHTAEAQIAELVAHVAADRDALVGLVQGTEQQLAALATRVEDVETQGPAQLADIHGLVEQLQHIQRDAEARLNVTGTQALACAEDGLQRIEMLVATQQLRDEQTAALLERSAADHEALVGLQRDSEQRLAVLATRLDGAEAGSTPQFEEFRQQLDQLHVEQREAEARVRAVAEDVAYRSRDANKAEVAELRTVLRHLTVNVRRLEVQLQHLGATETDAPGGTIAELAARVSALETATATAQPAAESMAAQTTADTSAKATADSQPPTAQVVPLAKLDGIGQRMSHAASSAYREGAARVSGAPTRQQAARGPITPQRRLQHASRRRDRAALGAASVVLGVLAAAGVLRFWEAPPRSVAPPVSVAAGHASSGATTIEPKSDPGNSRVIAPAQHVFETRLSVEPAFPGDAVLSKLEPAMPSDEHAGAHLRKP